MKKLNKLLFAVVLIACAFSFGCVENAPPQLQANASVAASSTSSASPNASVAPRASPSPIAPPNVSPSPGAWNDFSQSEVLVDFLYADWCGHCQKMKPVVAEAERAFPSERFRVRWWNEANRTNSKETMYVFDYYRRKGFFGGFPTFVGRGLIKRVGEMPRDDFFDWLCSFFKSPKPSECSEFAKKTW